MKIDGPYYSFWKHNEFLKLKKVEAISNSKKVTLRKEEIEIQRTEDIKAEISGRLNIKI